MATAQNCKGIRWVQCLSCSGWFHRTCAGVLWKKRRKRSMYTSVLTVVVCRHLKVLNTFLEVSLFSPYHEVLKCSAMLCTYVPFSYHTSAYILCIMYTSCSLATCSPMVPASAAAPRSHPLLVWEISISELYCGNINHDYTPVICSNGKCYFISNTLVSAVQIGFRKLDWNTGLA